MAGFHDQSNDRLAVTKRFRAPAAGTRIPNETSAEKKTKKTKRVDGHVTLPDRRTTATRS